jgi:endoglucanase
MNKKILGAFFIALALIIVLVVAYKNSQKREQTLVYSVNYMLSALWANYKKVYIESSSGRTLDPERGNITTSEGESYTMLRAVWEDDKTTFDTSWQWTETNLKRPNDNLFAWLYGQNSDKSYGILTSQGGENTASDADGDIALALVLASSRWQDPTYLAQAKKIISDIWANEVVVIKGVPYLTADNLEKTSGSTALLDPSYLSPASYKIFAQLDPADNWTGVVNSSYQVLAASSQLPADGKQGVNLPPDWVAIDKTTGQLEFLQNANLDSNYGFDALRVPFRLALDYQWNQDPRDKTLLQSFGFLSSQWENNKMLNGTYGHDGSVVMQAESPAMYGGSLGYFLIVNPSEAKEIYDNKLLDLYSPDIQGWKQQLGYYYSNWAWFGIALYNNQLINYYH